MGVEGEMRREEGAKEEGVEEAKVRERGRGRGRGGGRPDSWRKARMPMMKGDDFVQYEWMWQTGFAH